MKSVILFLGLILSSIVFGQKENEYVDYSNFDTAFAKEMLLQEFNRFRTQHNLKPYKFDTITSIIADYEASYTSENSIAKSYNEINFNQLFTTQHQGVLLITSKDRFDYFNNMFQTNKELVRFVNSAGFSRDGFSETYETFALGTLAALITQHRDARNLIIKDDENTLIGFGISFTRKNTTELKGYEVYVNILFTKDI